MKFLCRMDDYDDGKEWAEVDAIGPVHAAKEYAKRCDDNSAGELYQDSTRDKRIIHVIIGATKEVATFEIGFDYSKDFFLSRTVAVAMDR